MVAENYRGKRLLCAYVQFLVLSGSPSEVSVFPEAEGQIALISTRLWKAAAGRCGDSSPSLLRMKLFASLARCTFRDAS